MIINNKKSFNNNFIIIIHLDTIRYIYLYKVLYETMIHAGWNLFTIQKFTLQGKLNNLKIRGPYIGNFKIFYCVPKAHGRWLSFITFLYDIAHKKNSSTFIQNHNFI